MKKVKPIEEWLIWKLCEKAMKWILIIASVVLICVVGATVFIRYCLSGDFFGSDEIITLFAMWLYWLGGAYGSYEGSHITADLTNLFIKNEKALHGVHIFVNAMNVIITGIFSYWAIFNYALWNISSGKVTSGLSIPFVWSDIAITVSFVLMFIYSVYHLVRLFIPRADAEVVVAEGGEA